jgi:hypothetical protein
MGAKNRQLIILLASDLYPFVIIYQPKKFVTKIEGHRELQRKIKDHSAIQHILSGPPFFSVALCG